MNALDKGNLIHEALANEANTSLEMRRRPLAERKIGFDPALAAPYASCKQIPVQHLTAEAYKELAEMERKANAKPAKPFPKVGDVLTIKHQVKRTSTGDVLGVQRADGKGNNVTIAAVYMDGTVRVGHSEVWDVKPGTKGHWETVNPMHAERFNQ